MPLRAFVSAASLRWVLRHRAVTPDYLLRYWRFLRLPAPHPDVVLEGLVFLGRDVVYARPGYGRVVLGPWVHLGDLTRCAHTREPCGSVTRPSSAGRTPSTATSTWTSARGASSPTGSTSATSTTATTTCACRSRTRASRSRRSASAPDVWLGVQASVLRGTRMGHGCVLAAHTVVKGEYPPGSVIAGRARPGGARPGPVLGGDGSAASGRGCVAARTGRQPPAGVPGLPLALLTGNIARRSHPEPGATTPADRVCEFPSREVASGLMDIVVCVKYVPDTRRSAPSRSDNTR